MNPPDPLFQSLAASWLDGQTEILLRLVWLGHDRLRRNAAAINSADLERSITQLLEPRIRAEMTGFEPFYIQHGPYERETMALPPAQPPQYDLAFVWRADERIMWPLEAKVLETPGQVSDYVRDVREEFLKCRYAPFTSGGAMLGYLISGQASKALDNIELSLGCKLHKVPAFSS